MKRVLVTLGMFLCVATLIKAQNHFRYETGSDEDIVTSPDGGVCLMGGSSENDEAMKWFLERANGGDILVLRASGSDGYNDYFYSELGVTINSVVSIVCLNASASEEEYVLDKIDNAEAIWIAGGDQWNYVSYWRDSSVAVKINEAITDRNIVIGGTSAGMAIMGGYYFSAENGTVTSGQALDNPYRDDVTVGSAPFIENNYLEQVITDTHYDDPDRKGRHLTFLARIAQDDGVLAKGIACEERTAVCIDENGIARTFGNDSVNDIAYFVNTNCELADGFPENCVPNEPLTWNHEGLALKVYEVNASPTGENSFDLSDWQTGEGGVWKQWSAENGELVIEDSAPADCGVNVVETSAESVFQVYPNPSNGSLTISGFTAEQNAEVKISDMTGKEVFVRSGSLSRSIDVSHLTSGSYLMTISAGNVVHVERLVID